MLAGKEGNGFKVPPQGNFSRIKAGRKTTAGERNQGPNTNDGSPELQDLRVDQPHSPKPKKRGCRSRNAPMTKASRLIDRRTKERDVGFLSGRSLHYNGTQAHMGVGVVYGGRKTQRKQNPERDAAARRRLNFSARKKKEEMPDQTPPPPKKAKEGAGPTECIRNGRSRRREGLESS